MSTLKPTTYESIVKTLRQTILSNCGLASERCLNSLSARGTDLSELISSSQSYSHDMGTSFMLFELLRDATKDNYVTPGESNDMLAITAYTFHMICYGNGSDLLANKLRTMFKDPSIAQDLREEGIFVTGVTGGESIHEFVNNTMLLRVDLDMSFEALSDIPSAKPTEYFQHEGLTGDSVVLTVREVDED